MDEFEMFLQWRFGVKIGKTEFDINRGKIWAFILSVKQAQQLSLLSPKEWESKRVTIENWIAHTRRIPVTKQGNSGCELNVNQLKMWGSDLFIEAMMESLINPRNQRSEQTYIVPIDQIIRNSRDEDDVRFLDILVNSDEIEMYKEQFIPLDLIDYYKKKHTEIQLKTGLLVSLALTYRDLRSWCAALDKVQYTGIAEKDSDNSVKAENYKANEQACRNSMRECEEYMRLLGWR